MEYTVDEAEQRGMKNIEIWNDHVKIELKSKTVKVFYNGHVTERREN